MRAVSRRRSRACRARSASIPNETSESIAAEFFAGSLIAESEYPAVIAALEQGLKGDKEHAARFDSLRLLDGSERIKAYQSIFCTAELEPRKNIVSKGIREKNPSLFQRLMSEQERVCGLIARRRAVETRERTAALVTIVMEVIARYRAEKERRGLLDYDDLIDKTLHLLTEQHAQWVHYKLDLGIDHVLIDEAQDTSPKQWDDRAAADRRVLRRPRRARCDALDLRGRRREAVDLLVPGRDPGAVRRRTGGTTRASSRAAALRFDDVKFKYSFRSAPLVLEAVDEVFRAEAAHAGLTEVKGATVHEAVRANAPGLVELWPMIEPDEKIKLEGWDAPFDEAQETSPRVRLARKIAKAVRHGSTRGDLVGDGDKRHAARAGDILVLVRQRGALFNAVIYELKREGVAVAGADRLILTEHIAVMDLMALADALLLPDDDLALATVLKSPLFGLNEEQIFTLAWNRKTFAARDACGRARTRWTSPTRTRGSTATPNGRGTMRRSRSMRASSGPSAGARIFTGGSGRRRPTRSMNSSNSRLIYERQRGADLAGLRRMAARGPHRSETRHGHRARRGAGDDRARRQGAGGADRDPGRHHDAAEGAEGAAPAQAAGRECRAGHAGPDRVGGTQGRRRRARSRMRARRRVGGRRGRVPAAALCGDDARGGPAGGGGLARREPDSAGLLVRADRACAEAGGDRRAGGRRRRHRAALAQVGGSK